MGQLVIEVPQNINLTFSVESVEVADEILRLVKKPKELKTFQLNYPYDMDDVDASEALGIWADRKETADEIARAIRDKNNGKI
ncbi:MAG: hypothetical protein H0W45_05805 [Acidobacteria bacterium]|nr:hypothetical protein [Acidobacteriota bacterium]